MDKPLIVVNFKTYESAQGASSEELAYNMQEMSHLNSEFVAVVSPFDLESVCEAAPKIQVWTQHLDSIGFGSNTGWLHPQTAMERGAVGTIINHAEHKIPHEQISALIDMLPDGFMVCACAASIEEAKILAKLNPDMIAVEPPELIGGDLSVTSADPSIVSGTVEAVKSINPDVRVLCGAGVKNGEDVAKAIELGSTGVLLASGVTKSKNQKETLEDLISKI